MLIIILIAEKTSKRANKTQEKSFRKAQCCVTLIASLQNSESHSPTHLMFPYDVVRKVHTEENISRKHSVCVTLIVFLPSVMFMEKLHFCDDIECTLPHILFTHHSLIFNIQGSMEQVKHAKAI